MLAEQARADLCAAAGTRGWSDDPALLAPRLTDWRGRHTGAAALLLRPDSTAAVQAIVRAAARHRVPIVPQGGNSGMVAGATPDTSGASVLLSLERLNRIRSIDPAGQTLTAEAGVVLDQVHAAAAEHGLAFPLTLGAHGTATVGGLVSTNAGGVQVLRHGTMRAQVLGLEAVLPDGSRLDQLAPLRKDNTGYDIKQLLIGAEGTLGIVTAAALKLVAAPRARATAVAGVASLAAALALLMRLRGDCGDSIDSVEMVPRVGLELVLEHIAGTRDPLAAPHPFYVLIALASPDATAALDERLLAVLLAARDAGEVGDAVVAQSAAQADAFWRLREDLPLAEKSDGQSLKHDIAVPVAALPAFADAARDAILARWPQARILAFGHLGDGNLHYNVRRPEAVSEADWLRERDAVMQLVNDIVAAHGGSISAEHGIGQSKRAELARLCDPGKYAAMRAVKAALDPLGIMNPGKLL